ALRYKESVDELKRALSLDPTNDFAKQNLATTYSFMAESYMNQGQPAEAIEAFTEVIRLKPDDVDARIGLALCYSDQKRPDDAIKILKDVIRLKRDSDVAHYNLGLMYLDVKDKNAAMDEYHELQKLKSD